MNEFVMVDYAKYFAIGAHGNQKRKYTNLPYWTHLQEVVSILFKYCPDITSYIVAWLHDTVEDTWVTCFDIQEHFNDEIALYVSQLTIPSNDFGNRKKRMNYYNSQLAESCPLVQTVKYADLLDNTSSIEQYDPDFAKIYLKEKRALLPLIDKGNKELYKVVCKQVGL